MALIILACNQGCFPQIDAADAAWLSRLVVIPFRAKFCASTDEFARCKGEPFTYLADSELGDVLEEERYLLAHVHILMEGYRRYLDNKRMVTE